MDNTEPDIEILELAISRELDAHAFYAAMAKRTEDPQMKTILENFAAEELEHKTRLELELMKLGIVVRADDQAAAAHRPDDELVESYAEMDYKDAVVFAIEKEQKSLRLYIELAAMTKDKASREMLITLAQEEAMHSARFEAEYNLLMRKSSQ